MSNQDPAARPSSNQPDLPRRDFLRLTALSVAGLAFTRLPAVAGPFTEADFEKLVPSDKKLSAAWLRSLFERGEAQSYSGMDARFIGMPVGGLNAGQLYLGGDGRLWLWDVFNQPNAPEFADTTGPHYAKPKEPFSPIEQGFALQIKEGGRTQARPLDRRGFAQVTFQGQYPIGLVRYEDPQLPVRVELQAFSPFIPLNLADSELPATIMEYTVTNTSAARVEVEIAGWMENASCLGSGRPGRGLRRNRVRREGRALMVSGTAEASPPPPTSRSPRPDILFDDFEKGTYEGWEATGTAFGTEPMERSKMPAYQGEIGQQGKRLVNTHNARQGEDVGGADAHVGTLTSRTFTLERDYINFLIGGGGHKDRTCMHLFVEDKRVLSATGHDDNRMQAQSWDVRQWAGRSARLQIVDQERGGWGHIGIDNLVFSDTPCTAPVELVAEEDFGSVAIAVVGPGRGAYAVAGLPAPGDDAVAAFRGSRKEKTAAAPFGQKLVGAVGRTLTLQPGASATVTFVLAWHFAAIRRGPLSHVTDVARLRRSYATRFGSAAAVACYAADNLKRLAGDTRLWHRTWYLDSTLPWWFLDRTFLNNSIAATATCLHFDSGRFYGWEGTYCCAGTCQHVWQYAQGLARTFPQLERAAREFTDYGIAFREDGALDYRAEAHRVVAIDGQAGTILRVYREHQMSADDAFLKRIWPRVKKSIEHLMARDGNDDGVLEGEQYNTLDASWYGQIPWLSSLYLAAVRAGAAMAREMGDEAFVARCDRIAESGGRLIAERLFNGEYFIHKVDPTKPEFINTNDGCHIDQVYGQSWAFQVGLPRVLPAEQTHKALESLWKYSFTPDVGVYRKNFEAIKAGRWYAMPGEGGLLMCTWPKGGGEKAAGKGERTFVGYFNECMTGFEYQVAGHMIWEGLVEKGLAITRMIHDRYHGSKRNPWNEVECSSHYARAMASYGVYLAACGFEYHGPRGHLGFAPRMGDGEFRAAFTAAEGWGALAQKREVGGQRSEVSVRWGRVRLNAVGLQVVPGQANGRVQVQLRGKPVQAAAAWQGAKLTVTLAKPAVLQAGDTLEIAVQS